MRAGLCRESAVLRGTAKTTPQPNPFGGAERPAPLHFFDETRVLAVRRKTDIPLPVRLRSRLDCLVLDLGEMEEWQ